MNKKYRSILIAFLIIILTFGIFPISEVKAAYEPKMAELPYDIKFTEVDGRYALDEDGNLWLWGATLAYGSFEDGTTGGTSAPKQVKTSVKFKKIANDGYKTYIAIDVNGNLWSWGDNNELAMLGNGCDIDYSTTASNEVVNTPTQITTGTKFTKVSIGTKAVLALDENGNIWGWGANEFGELLNNGKGNQLYADHYYYQNVPKQLTTGTKYIDIQCEGFNAGAIDENNNLYLWGSNSYGQLAATSETYTFDMGLGSTVHGSYTPILIKSGTKFIDFSIGENYVVAIDSSNNLWSWGRAKEGGLGIKISSLSTSNGYVISGYMQTIPLKVGSGYTDVYCANGITYAKKDDENYVWGDNTSGRFGNGTTTSSETPQYVSSYSLDIVGYGLGIDENGDLWAWGLNYIDADGNTVQALEPIQITGAKSEYTVTFMNGTETVKTETVTEGGAATAPTLTKAGYTLSWDTDFSNVTSNLTVKAVWTANTNTAYKIEHYKQNTSLNGYTLAQTENKTGTTGAVAVATAKTYEGFKENTTYSGRVATGNVAGDGSLVLKLYYDRNSYSITLNTNEGTINSGNVTSYTYGVGATLPTNVTKTGYTFAGWYSNSSFTGSKVTSISTTDTGSKTYYAKWTTNTFTVTFKNGETTEKTQTVDYGSSATAPELTKAGYTLSWDKDFSNITSDITANAVWTANTNTPYKIENYLRTTDLEVEEYYLYETTTSTGTTDTNIAIGSARTYKGFTENKTHSERVASGKIAGDGSLVLKLYYDRNTYNVTLNTNEGTINSGNVTSYVYGIGATLPTNVTKTGYTFAGWYDNSDLTGDAITSIGEAEIEDKTFYAKWTQNQFTVTFKNGEQTVKTQIVNAGDAATAPSLTKAGYTLSWDTDFSNVTSDLTVNAIWTANTNTVYKVEHYVRNLDTEVEGYDLRQTEILTGTTDTTVTATAKTYVGFTENTKYSGRVTSGNVAGDGSLVLKLYYNRNSYNISYELNGGTATSYLTNTYTYGKELILSSRVSKTGYVFAGWYDNKECTGETITSISETETGDKTFYAKWTSEGEYYITSEKHSINVEENQITKISPSTNVEELINNLNTNGAAKILNAKGEEVTGSTLVGTGCKLQVEYKGEKYEYEIAVRGDLDGNGKVSITDLSILNQVLVKKLTVTGVRQKAADIDYSNKATITDLSMMNQAIVGKTEL